MPAYTLVHLSDRDLLTSLAALVAQDRATTAALLAHLAETDARRLYVPAGYPSMYDYCLHELHLPEQAALKRIRVGRTARRFPAIFPALADGRLHLSGVLLLAPYLTSGNANELLEAAAHRSKAEIELLLAQRFPKPDVPARLQAIRPPAAMTSLGEALSPGTAESVRIGALSPGTVQAAISAEQVSPGTVNGTVPAGSLSPGTVEMLLPKLKPLSPERFALQLTIGQGTHDKLRHAQALLGHRIPSGDLAQVLDRALDALIGQLEKRKLAATDRPRTGARRRAEGRRTIPAQVRRAVWERDGARCTFVGETGQRCPARARLEFDHVEPVARGGRATVAGIRLRCRAHNQYEAERAFGAGFMSEKREAARRATQQARARAAAAAEVIPYLRALGFQADESRRAAAHGAIEPGASLEDRVRRALSYFRPRAHSHAPAAASHAGAS